LGGCVWSCSETLRNVEDHLKVIKYLRSVTLYSQGLKVTEDGIDVAAKYGHLEVVDYLYKRGVKASGWGIERAAMNSHLEVVKYLYEQGLKVTEDGIDVAT
jgi:hypothetical protein